MSGLDKHRLMQDLLAQGWTEAPELGEYILRPPRALIESLSAMHFHVHDASDLQSFVKSPDATDFNLES